MNIKAVSSLALGWLIPGLGHIAVRKYWRGIIFFVCISLMATLGLIMEGRIYSYQTENPLTVLGFFSDIGLGLFYLISRAFSIGVGNLKNVSYEFGTTFIAGAGLLNFLVALDARDIAAGKKK